MDLDDPRWTGLTGGYRTAFDPRQALRVLRAGDAAGWGVLWQELHHQGDVGEASYAAVPEIVSICEVLGTTDWNPYALLVTIEECRLSGRNPPLPEWIAADYRAAWERIVPVALDVFATTRDETLSQSLLAVLAMARGHVTLARLAMLDESERQEMLDEVGWG